MLPPNTMHRSLPQPRLFTFFLRGERWSPISHYPPLIFIPLLVQYNLPLPSCNLKTRLKVYSTKTCPIWNNRGKGEEEKRHNWLRYKIYTLQSNEKICIVTKVLVSATAPKVTVDIYNFLLLLFILCSLCLRSKPQLIEMIYLVRGSNHDC